MSRQREILALAVPAFISLVVEPLFLLADSAIVGHLGTTELAGLGVASAALVAAVNVFVFLAYGTTSIVARQVGAGDVGRAVAAGVDGVWLAVGLGVVTGGLLLVGAPTVAGWFGAGGAVAGQAVDYLRVAAAGVPAMLVVLAVTGVLRGLQDTRTPVVVAGVGFTANIALNLLFVNGLHWGIAGSAAGTVIAQNGMAVAMLVVLLRAARRYAAPLRPHPGRVLAAGLHGIPLLVRTLALRAIILLTTAVAAHLGVVTLAAHQVAATVWSFLAFALDALAIAAQALTGRDLGRGDVAAVRETTTIMVSWGVGAGVVLGGLVVALHGVLPRLFTPDPQVQRALAAALVVVGLSQVVAGYVFVLDGVLIGAGDGRWLAGGMLVVLALYLPIVLSVQWTGGWWAGGDAAARTAVLWVAFTGFMVIRGVVLWWRARSDAWMVTGAQR